MGKSSGRGSGGFFSFLGNYVMGGFWGGDAVRNRKLVWQILIVALYYSVVIFLLKDVIL